MFSRGSLAEWSVRSNGHWQSVDEKPLGICFAICANLAVSSTLVVAGPRLAWQWASGWQVAGGTEKPRLCTAKPPPDDPVAEAWALHCTAL
ncbi:hypothetical protein E4U28_006614 [Claviceps purpurea]|nr:hypothetical protein E4U28_006614 [Claviceps purpurea]